MAFRRGYQRFRRQPRRRVYRRKGVKRVSKSIKSYVKKAIHRNIENKEFIQYTSNQSVTAAQQGVTLPTAVNLIPPVISGSADYNRVGNEIKIMKAYVKGFVNILPYNATTNPTPPPVYVKIFFLRSLTSNQTNNATSAASAYDWAQTFSTNNVASGFQNSTLDLMLPLNKDYWKLLGTKLIKLGVTGATSTGPTSTGAFLDNSSMSRPFYFNWGKKCRKVLKYNDSQNNNYCVNDNVIMVIQPISADGTTASTPIEYHYVNRVSFEDA